MFCIDDKGQASVEAAVLIPITMCLIGLLLQPICLLYTRQVMQQSAGEAMRILATSDDISQCEDFIIRRMRAIPDISILRYKSPEITISKASKTATIKILQHVKPIPVLGIPLKSVFECDELGFIVTVELTQEIVPKWQEGDYTDWIEAFS